MIHTLLKPAALCCVVAALAGCAMSPIPVAENFPLTTQKKVRSAGHWNQLSQDVVAQTLVRLEKAGATPQTSLYVAMAPNAGDFDRAFHEFLVTELVQRGWSVLTTDNAALTVTYQSQIIKHNSERPRFVPGLFTSLTAGLYVLHNVTAAAGSLLLAGALDYGSSANTGGPTHTELILTTTVAGNGRYVSRKTDVYYVEESDTSLFNGLYKSFAGTGMRVVGP